MFSDLIGILHPSRVTDLCPWVWNRVGSNRGNESSQCEWCGKDSGEGGEHGRLSPEQPESVPDSVKSISDSSSFSFCCKMDCLHIRELITCILNTWRNEQITSFARARIPGL